MWVAKPHNSVEKISKTIYYHFCANMGELLGFLLRRAVDIDIINA